ncbi:autotransporter outer membrane beta-barrel domain-containing protein [Hankyongella ginsenosidimutans]|uniref:autotransporter outer membrane beta-barrel domain-containing protein n=1 Tax=Hankyongella ginsenosidimutans TaxID=1763828 RepID=UPI0024825949|nr:autotransporter outer membrane beta-barrel domain-containing protein [Hankyongella ginsenosidimutans]
MVRRPASGAAEPATGGRELVRSRSCPVWRFPGPCTGCSAAVHQRGCTAPGLVDGYGRGKACGQVWARGIGLWGSSGNARQTDVSGVAGGFSLTLGHLGEAGIAAGYMDASLRAPGSTDTDGTMSTVSVSGFGRITVARVVIDALVGYQDGKAREFVRGVGERRGKPDTQSWFADFGVGLPLASGSWQWLPRLGLRYAATKLPNFTDSGGLIGPATIRADRLNATYFTAGLRTQWRPGSPTSSMHVLPMPSWSNRSTRSKCVCRGNWKAAH